VVTKWLKKLAPAVVVVALLLVASSLVHTTPPTQGAEDVVTQYGADANPTGNPIGGGYGYVSPHGYSQATADYVVTTVSQLSTALASATSGQVIWIPSGTTITISSAYGKTIKSGVVLASSRGKDGAAGGKIKWTYTSGSGMTALLSCQSNSRVSGVVLEGPIGTSGTSGTYGGSNIGLRGVNGSYGIEVENCEISKFALAGIYFNDGLLNDSNRHYVHHCYIHNCQRHGFGYGISEEGSSAFLAEANIFDENRHHIMAQAGLTNPNSYEVRYNKFYEAIYASDGDIYGTWYYSHQVDCHGGADYGSSYYAGNILKIHHNTFYENPGKPNVCIRGIPKTLCEVSWNWTVKNGTDAGQTPSSSQWAQYVSTSYYQRMTVHDNWYGTTPPSGGPVNGAPATPSAPVGTSSGVISTEYQYQATTTDPNGDRVSYTFSWGDGSTSTTGLFDSGATASAGHTWTQSGTYSVYVRATDSEGAASAWSSEKTVQIAASSSNAPATPPAPVGTSNGVISTEYQYQARTTDPDGDQVSYTFYWGDGSTSTTGLYDSGATASASHTWTQSGTNGVYVRATDSEGNVSAWSSAITVQIADSSNDPPAKPSAPVGTSSGVILTQYEYRTSTADPDGDRVWYTFYWGDGSTSTTDLIDSGETAFASHTWTQSGSYGVYVKATDSEGDVSAWSSGTTVKITRPLQPSSTTNDAPYTPSLASGTTSGETSVAYEYTAVATDPDADALLYTFNWGDGTISTTVLVDSGVATSVSHTWTEPGTYAVQVEATDSQGAVSDSSTALSVTILTPPPAAPEPGPDTPATVTPETPGENSPDGQSEAVETPTDNPPDSQSDAGDDASEDLSPPPLDNGDSPPLAGQESNLGWWLLGFIVMVGAAVLLTGAIVRETIPRPPKWGDGSGDR
jgi:hypothetical protein